MKALQVSQACLSRYVRSTEIAPVENSEIANVGFTFDEKVSHQVPQFTSNATQVLIRAQNQRDFGQRFNQAFSTLISARDKFKHQCEFVSQLQKRLPQDDFVDLVIRNPNIDSGIRMYSFGLVIQDTRLIHYVREHLKSLQILPLKQREMMITEKVNPEDLTEDKIISYFPFIAQVPRLSIGYLT